MMLLLILDCLQLTSHSSPQYDPVAKNQAQMVHEVEMVLVSILRLMMLQRGRF